MAVLPAEVRPGAFFRTNEGDLRKVFRVANDQHGRPSVWFQWKPMLLPARPLLFGHAQARPIALEDFAAQCAHRLSEPELHQLRERGILLPYE